VSLQAATACGVSVQTVPAVCTPLHQGKRTTRRLLVVELFGGLHDLPAHDEAAAVMCCAVAAAYTEPSGAGERPCE
jgi:hypothetical protein